MDLAIIHYHLNRGGVAGVIAGHLRALAAAPAEARPARVAILYGGRREGWPDGLPAELAPLPVELRAVPELDYDDGRPARPEALAAKLRAALAELGFAADSTILHVHNHALGKNVSLPGALGRLADEGYRLLLQIHDFAEDLRPAMYARLRETLDLGDALYPQGAGIHYATLNRRDAGILERAGMEPRRVHLLPNPVFDLGELPPRERVREKLAARRGVPADAPLLVYPVRGITRKNLGEMLLWSAATERRAWFALTLPPLNPVEKPLYEHWKRLAAELQLACAFEIGAADGLEFAESLAAADRFLTTSLAEGFGMAFLETWLAGRPLVGRDLPKITADFARAGLRFPGLVPALYVPIDWVGRDAFCEMFVRAYRQTLTAYNRPTQIETVLRHKCELLIDHERINFGALDAALQEQVIRRVHATPAARAKLLEWNPILHLAATPSDDAERQLVERNAAAAREHYSLAACGARLTNLYQQLAAEAARREPPLAAETILETFLDLRRFRPLRVG